MTLILLMTALEVSWLSLNSSLQRQDSSALSARKYQQQCTRIDYQVLLIAVKVCLVVLDSSQRSVCMLHYNLEYPLIFWAIKQLGLPILDIS